MATERIDIIVREKGSRVVRRSFRELSRDALTAKRSVDTFRTALAAIGVGLVVRETLRLADTFQNLQNRLRVVTETETQLRDVTEQLFAVSQRTRSSFESSVELYSRLAISSKELGVNQQQLVQFTESLNQAIILSGASAQEANAGLIQLSQGIASGTLRGDELRSVLEQLPVVADVIAKELGVTRGELRELGFQGKITAQDIIIAFQSSRNELQERFGKTVPTINQALQVLRNSLVRAAETDLGGLTDAIVGLADKISDPTFQASFGAFVAGVVKFSELSFEGLGKFAEIGQGLGITAARLQGFEDADDPLAVITAAIERTERDIREVERRVEGRGFAGRLGAEEGAAQLAVLNEELELFRRNQTAIEQQLGSTEGYLSSPVAASNTPDAEPIIRAAQGPDPKALAAQEDFLQGLRDQAVELGYQVQLGDDAAAAISRYNLAIELAAQQATPQLTEQAIALNDEIIKLTEQLRVQEEQQRALANQQDFLQAIDSQIGLLQLQRESADFSAESLERYRLTTEAAALGDEQFVANAQAKIEALVAEQSAVALLQEQQSAAARILEEIATPQQIFTDQQTELIELYKQGFLTAEQYRQALILLSEEFAKSVEEVDPALQNLNNFLRRAQENMQDLLANSLRNGFEDGFDGIKESFANLLLDLASQYLASEIFRIIGQSTAGGSGGFAQFFQGAFAGGFANGGSFTVPGQGAPDSRLVSMALTPGENVTVTKPGEGPASQPVVVQSAAPQVIVVNDEKQAIAAMQTSEGEQVVVDIMRRNKDALNRDFA